MNSKSFFKLVEIQTKVASMVPFFTGSLFTIYHYNKFDIKNFILMFISLLCFDMVATTINNYIDYKDAEKQHGYNYEKHNAIVSYGLEESTVIKIIIILFSIASITGFMLYLNTDSTVLILGIISFIVGILYSFGPIPISRMPLGEIFSGFFMGFIIIFLASYIHIFSTEIVNIFLRNEMINIIFNYKEIIKIFFISLPAVNGIANIMLANNICDVEDDLENKRFTLVIHIGVDKALSIFKLLYYFIYINITVLVILDILPIFSLLVLISYIPVKNNINKFYKKQKKNETFVLSVKNFLLINLSYAFSFIIAKLIEIL
ncbi:MAG: 1,4-dihydroxy-2-naphthoate polyprenyltransferase [Bacillota bacterium]